MPRILAIDFGLKRCGIAVSDPLQIIAGALTTVDSGQLIQFLSEYMVRESVETIVVGYPLGLDNKPTHATAHVDQLLIKLEKKWPDINLQTEDERYTSKEALQALIQSGVRKKARRDKKLIDQVSATIILQNFMESQSK